MKLRIVSWDLRDLNGLDERKIVKYLLWSYNPDLVCFQELKMSSMSIAIISSLGMGWNLGWSALDA